MPQVVTFVVDFAAKYIFAEGARAFVIRTLLTIGISTMIAKRQMTGFGQSDAGARLQLAPATDNLLPVVYGKAFIKPTITDAKISNDNKTMWYCCTLSEVPQGSTVDFGKIYWNGAEVTLGTGQYGGLSNVTRTTNNAGEVDNKINGFVEIFKFPNGVAGSQTNGNTGTTSAVDIMSDASIPNNLKWNGGGLGNSIYTQGGQSVTMTDTAFLIIKVTYNTDANITALGEITVELENSIDKPGDAIKDYLLSETYGCAVPLSQIDTASLTALNTYSDEQIDFDSGASQQARYRINGPLNTAETCMANLQELADACDSWIQYSSLTNQWKVVINKEFDGLEADLYHVDASYNNTQANLVGGIDVNPIDLNSTYNSLQVAYPNENIRDQTDYQLFDLSTYNTAVMSYGEPENKLDINLPQVNNYIQAAYIGIRRMLQSREDLTISLRTDYSGIAVEAGDVIRVTSAEYGWDGASFPNGKLFRVSTVNEISDQQNNLYAEIQAFEYNATIYTNNALTNFIPADNTGLADPNIIGIPPIPTAAVTSDGALATLRITATIPTGGITQFLDFNYGLNSDPSTHELYRTVSLGSGNPFIAGSTYTIDINDLPPATYYFSIVARNQQVGQIGSSSNAIVWAGTNINPATNYFPTNCTSSGTTITCNPVSGLPVDAYVFVTSGTGEFASGTQIIQVNSTTEFIVSATPTIALSGADVRAEYGGLPANSVGTVQIVDLAVMSEKMADLAIIESKLADDAVARAKLLDGAVDSVKLATSAVENLNIAPNAVTEVKIDNDSISAPKIKANAVETDKLAANAVVAGKILAGTIDATRISTGTLTSASGVFGTISADNVTVGTLNGSTVNITNLNANNITSGTIDAGIINVGNINANDITSGTLNTARLNVNDIISTGSITVIGDNITDFTNNAGYTDFVGGDVNANVTSISGGVITTGTVNAARVSITNKNISDLNNDSGFIDVGDINGNVTSIDGGVITTGTVNSLRLNTDTLDVKHFADVSVDIINQTGGTVPLRVQAKNSQWNGTFVGSQINSVEAVYMNTTTPNIRNGATYQVIYSAVLGNTRVGTIEYSYNQSTWVSLGGVGQGTTSMNTDAGNNYRTYVFAWQGQLTGMTSAQQTVYWRVKWNNFGSQFNSTYQSIYIDIDNTT